MAILLNDRGWSGGPLSRRGRFCPLAFLQPSSPRAFSLKSNPPNRGLRRRHEFPDGVEDNFELRIILLFKLSETSGQLLVGRDHLPQPHEGPHNFDIDLNRSFALEYAGEHGDALRVLTALTFQFGISKP